MIKLCHCCCRYGWYPYPCSSTWDYICEMPWSAISCPSAPPPMPPPTPPVSLCKRTKHLPSTSSLRKHNLCTDSGLIAEASLRMDNTCLSCLPATGLPAENDRLYCPVGGASCYFAYYQSRTYAEASAACAALKGAYLVSFNSGRSLWIVLSCVLLLNLAVMCWVAR
jgi:hypothetical protein